MVHKKSCEKSPWNEKSLEMKSSYSGKYIGTKYVFNNGINGHDIQYADV